MIECKNCYPNFWSSLHINLIKFSDSITFFCICPHVSSSHSYPPLFIIICKRPLLMHRMRKQLFQVHQWTSIWLCITHQMRHIAITCQSFSPWEPKFICQGRIWVPAAKNVHNSRLDVEEILYMAGWSRVIRVSNWVILVVKGKTKQNTSPKTPQKTTPQKNPQEIL